jgi:O-antigen/teichoic acid export membrane protein
MSTQKSLTKNVVYNSLYTGLNLLFPLIIAPYVSRILGASNLGKVNFAATIINWFVLFAVFGTTTYGIREVAKIQNSKEQLNRLFSEVFIINGIFSVIVTIIYYIIIFNIENFVRELPLYFIMSLSIILNMFDIDWFYQGIEEYRYITIRSAVFKLISLISIFLFVKHKEHYIIYGLVSVLATSLSRILNYVYSRKYVKLTFRNINISMHFHKLYIFFVYTLIVNLYTNSDQVLLGFLINTKAVAFMNRCRALIGMAISVSTAISNATLSRASYYKENDDEKFRELISSVPNYILWITIPMTIGYICLASNIMYILGGKEFLEAKFLLQVMSLAIIFSPLSSYFQYSVLVASGKEKVGLKCAIITSLLSLIMNIILIPKIGFLGAGIVQTISEFIALAIRYYIVKKKLIYSEIKIINKSSVTYLVAAFVMGGALICIRSITRNLIIASMIGFVLGSAVYFLLLLLMREKIMISVLNKMIKSWPGKQEFKLNKVK